MAGRLVATSSLFVALGISAVYGQGSTTQSPASLQPTIPKPMPGLDMSLSNDGLAPAKRPRARHAMNHRHVVRHSLRSEPIDRPALANVELLEALPHPPEPPHVVVPTPAYPFESLAAGLLTPPPPIVCRPTRYDRFKPDLGLVDERPVLCTADNP